MKALIVDDSRAMRMVVSRIVTGLGFEVIEAGNGVEALEILRSGPLPDVALVDWNMPVMDGLSALPRIREVSPDTRVVMLTAVTQPEYRERARNAGAVAYLEKTTSVRVLVDELLRAADLLDTVLDGVAAPTHRGTAQDELTPRLARRFVADTLTAWGEEELRQVVQLLVSELVTNVIEHTETAPEVTVRLTSDMVHVEVSDNDPTMPAPREAALTDNSGRGLAFLDAFAAAWGTTATEHGKIVWFDVRRKTVPSH